jgi:hypothetical protein
VGGRVACVSLVRLVKPLGVGQPLRSEGSNASKSCTAGQMERPTRST